MATENITLQSELVAQVSSALGHGLHLMLYRQMYKRWRNFCELHEAQVQRIDEPGITGATALALPKHMVQQFVTNNIQWAKLKVQQRINRIMWPNNGVEAGSDDEYDPTA